MVIIRINRVVRRVFIPYLGNCQLLFLLGAKKKFTTSSAGSNIKVCSAVCWADRNPFNIDKEIMAVWP